MPNADRVSLAEPRSKRLARAPRPAALAVDRRPPRIHSDSGPATPRPLPKRCRRSDFATLEVWWRRSFPPTSDRQARKTRASPTTSTCSERKRRRAGLQWMGGLAALNHESTTRFRSGPSRARPAPSRCRARRHQRQNEPHRRHRSNTSSSWPSRRPFAATTRRRSAFTASFATRAISFCRSLSAARPKTARIVRIADRSICDADRHHAHAESRGRHPGIAAACRLDHARVRTVGRDRRRQRRRRRHGGVSTGDGRRESVAARSRPHDRLRIEYRTMEWPYASMRRHRLPPGERPIAVAEYNFLDRPYGNNPALAKYKKVASYVGQHLHP